MSTDQVIMRDASVPSGRTLVAGLCVAIVAYVPILGEHFKTLWGKEQYQYFPFVLAAVIAFLWQRSKDCVTVTPWRLRRPLMYGMAGVAWVALLVASVMWTPWLAAFSAVLAVGAVFLHVFRERAPENLWGIWLLLWLIVPPPLNYDTQLIAVLQRVSSRISSHILDLLNINHLMTGNVLEVPTKQFFVDEACSGIVSVMSVIAAGGIYCVWKNRHLIHVIAFLASGIAWAMMMNVARITLIAVAHEWWHIDLSTGWPHETLGLVLFSLTFIAMMSTDQVLSFGLAEIDLDKIGQNTGRANPLVRLWNRLVATFRGPPTHVGALSAASIVPLRWWVAIAFGLAIPLQLYSGSWHLHSDDALVKRAIDLPEELLQSEVGNWKRVKFERIQRPELDAFGMYSRTYTYEHTRTHDTVTISLDFPYSDFHDLCICYQGIGWELTERGYVEAEDLQEPFAWDYVTAKFSQTKENRTGHVLFCSLMADGSAFNAGDTRKISGKLITRVAFSRLHNSLQVQAWVPENVEEAVMEDVKALFLHARSKFREFVTAKP